MNVGFSPCVVYFANRPSVHAYFRSVLLKR